MSGQEVNNELAAAETATPDALTMCELDYAGLDYAMGGVRLEVRMALLAYQEASAAQERLLNHMERIVKLATGQVQHG